MQKAARNLVESMLKQAGITPGGNDPWDIRVYDDRLYNRVLCEHNLGLGEAYVEGWWDCPRVDAFISRVLAAGVRDRLTANIKLFLKALPTYLLNKQTKIRATKVAKVHYNLGNDLFATFLDPYLQYSCAFFKDTDDLDTAQRAKMDLICNKLELRPGDRVLDIGCGWGGLAKYMAETYGCHVTGVNISDNQIDYARSLCKSLPVTIVKKDYRDVEGRFDKIVSVGMFEHVGSKNYQTFMRKTASLLDEQGIFLLHTIGGNAPNVRCDPWITTYIFPNGMLPSIDQIARAAEGLFVVEDWHNIGPYYDPTLMAWHKRFTARWESLRPTYGQAFKRMWEYYLLSCAGAFRVRDIQVWQIVMTKQGRRQPVCR
ncbi:cyclopropane fatty acyl phospholipid synthase [Desulfoplanes sp. PS50]